MTKVNLFIEVDYDSNAIKVGNLKYNFNKIKDLKLYYDLHFLRHSELNHTAVPKAPIPSHPVQKIKVNSYTNICTAILQTSPYIHVLYMFLSVL